MEKTQKTSSIDLLKPKTGTVGEGEQIRWGSFNDVITVPHELNGRVAVFGVIYFCWISKAVSIFY